MPRRENAARRRDPPRRGGGRSGLFTGLVIGLTLGLVIAAAMAWYLNSKTVGFKPVEKKTTTELPTETVVKPAPPAVATVPKPPEPTAPETKKQPSASPPAPKADAASTPKPKVDYTFYGILPGDKPAKPIEPPKPKDLWWLQIAALSNPADADRLKAKLTLIGLQVSTQKIHSDKTSLYRVRVGPYKREDDALGDLDTLSANDFEARLLKEPINP